MNSFYFSVFRCSDCAKLKPNFDAAAEDFARKGKYVFAKVGVRSIICNSQVQKRNKTHSLFFVKHTGL